MEKTPWYTVKDTSKLTTPSLLLYSDRVRNNIEEMARIAGSPERLRPHVKTYKMGEVIKMQRTIGITKFKCATIAEAELLAKTSIRDILLAMQPVGPNIDRYFNLALAYPEISFSCLADNEYTIAKLAQKGQEKQKVMGVFIDIDNGMNRTGAPPDENVVNLYSKVSESSYLDAKGLHVYDGHLRLPDFEERRKACDEAINPVLGLKAKIMERGFTVDSIVVGGSPTFPAHAYRNDIVLSPGTVMLWDAGYGEKFPDMNFQYAAILTTRIISKPKPNQFTLDLGHKSLASEMPFPRVKFLNTNDFEQLSQSEEHLVVIVKNPERYEIGDLFYAVPVHICPTVAKYPSVSVVENGEIVDSWKVAARDHKISF